MKRGRGMQWQHPLSVLGISNFFSQNDLKTLKSLADFSIKYHFPEIKATNKAISSFSERLLAKRGKWLCTGSVWALYTE
jgi:uncharacterized protein YdiU (UPF0061 family)